MLIYIFFSALLAFASASQCDPPCNKPIARYYQILNCTAVYDNDACCPTRYDCSNFYPRKDRCYLSGVTYPTGTRLNGTTVGLPCDRCLCQARGGKAVWNCTQTTCNSRQMVPDNCRRLFTRDNCCPVGMVCENSRLTSQRFTCQVGNFSYSEGEVFEYPGDVCKRCICQRGFNGTFDGPWCRQKNCHFELRTKSIQDGCAPIFYDRKHCCPVDWRCPSSEDSVIPAARQNTSLATPGQCRFGQLVLNVGSRVSTGNRKCLECTCTIPPHVTCSKIPNCQECNIDKCNTPNLDLYRELNCTAVHENGECCPTSFDCSNVFNDKDHCHFGGVLFHHKEELVGSDVGLPCEHCTCHVHDQTARWSCAIPECFNWPDLPDTCHHIITQDNCCPVGILCMNNSTKKGGAGKKTFSCNVDGATYYEGHIFEPRGNEKPCRRCVCQRGFDGTFEAPWCDKLTCGYELHYWDKIQDGCVPVFAESEQCCPIEWQCPAGTDSVLPATATDMAPTTAQCVFGELRFNFLEMLKVTNHKCLMCTCYVPPFLTCTHEHNCQEE